MNLLLDTHVLLWALADSERLQADTRTAIHDASRVLVSAATAWEIEIKRALGKLEAPADLPAALTASGFEQLPIGFGHATVAGALPRHHDDPFDRMLIAQAQTDGLVLVTADHRVQAYPVRTLPA